MSLNNDMDSQPLIAANMSRERERGFTLVEALVGLTILAIGLLGLTGLQFMGMRNNHDAYLRSQAILQAYDILDRMRANRNGAVNGLYNIGLNETPDTADASLPAQDLRQWKASLANLPAGDGTIGIAGRVVTISVRWNEARDGTAAIQQFQTQSQL